MAKMIIRGKTLYIDYRFDGVRYKRTTNLKDTPENRKYVNNVLIPELNQKIEGGDLYRKKDKSFKYYGEILLSIKEKTLRTYSVKEAYYLRVIEYFGSKDIDTITRLDIKQFYNSLNMKALSKGQYRTCVVETFELAVDDGVLQFNPALNIDLGKDEKTDIQYFTKEEVNKLLSNAKGIIRPYLYIAFNTGLRPEEILGLQFTDIKDNLITISRARTKGRIDYPKTKNAYRKIRVPDFVINEIVQLKSSANSLYLFGDLDDSSRLRYQWNKVLNDSNIEYKKLSCTRHTYATHMLRNNVVSLNELSGLLGHSSSKVTLQHYASVIDSKEVDLGKDFNLFGNKKGNTKTKKVL